MMIVIADAGPLLHLFWVDALTWALPQQEIDVVEAVWYEVDSYAPDVLRDPRLRRISALSPVPQMLSEKHLDSGEEAALAYALAQPPGTELVILSDDRNARRACQEFALPLTGSLGLIIAAYHEGQVGKELAELALRDLPTRGRFYVKPALITQALNKLKAGNQP